MLLTLFLSSSEEFWAWWNFWHYYAMPLYTYWYYFGSLFIVLSPFFIKFIFRTIKYLMWSFYILSIECFNLIKFTFTKDNNINSKYKMKRRNVKKKRNRESFDTTTYNEYNSVVSPDDIFFHIRASVSKIKKVLLIISLILFSLWFFLHLLFIYNDKLSEIEEIQSKSWITVNECSLMKFISNALKRECDKASKEIQKSSHYYACHKTFDVVIEDITSMIYSPFMWLIIFVISIYAVLKLSVIYADYRKHQRDKKNSSFSMNKKYKKKNKILSRRKSKKWHKNNNTFFVSEINNDYNDNGDIMRSGINDGRYNGCIMDLYGNKICEILDNKDNVCVDSDNNDLRSTRKFHNPKDVVIYTTEHSIKIDA